MNQHAPSVRRPATYQDVLDAPETMVAELVEGALHLHPRPASRHVRASSSLGDELMSPYDKGRGGPGGWWILDEPELHLGRDILVPDLTDKRRLYAEAGVAHLWFVDPIDKTLEAFTLRDGAWTLVAALRDDEEVRVAPFDAIAFQLSVLWPD